MPTVQCTCGARYKVSSESAGRKARCRKCGETFRIPESASGPIPIADGPDLAGLAHAESAAPAISPPASPAETASDSMFETSGASTAYEPDRPRKSLLPRERPRTGFWADVGWTLLFFASPHNLIMFGVVWAAVIAQSVLWKLAGSMFLMGILVWAAAMILRLYVTAWLMAIIPETAGGEEDLPNMPGVGGFIDDVLIPAIQYHGTLLVLLIPAITYVIVISITPGGIAFSLQDLLDPYSLLTGGNAAAAPLLALVIGAVFLWPIAIMCVSMAGLGALVRIDLIVIAVARSLPAYIVIFVLVGAASFLPGWIIEATTSTAGGTGGGSAAFTHVLPTGVGLYFSAVTMRLIGLYYRHFKQRFPWDWE